MLPIRIDKYSGIPLYIQLAERIRLLIREGALKAGDMMPTVRELAVDLGVNANTIARVYRELQSEGILRLERGIGTTVAAVMSGGGSGDEFQAVEAKANELIALAKRLGMTAVEVSQLVEARWNEVQDEH